MTALASSSASAYVLPTPASTPPPLNKKSKSYTNLQQKESICVERRKSFSSILETQMKAKKMKKKSTPSFANLLRAAGFGKARDAVKEHSTVDLTREDASIMEYTRVRNDHQTPNKVYKFEKCKHSWIHKFIPCKECQHPFRTPVTSVTPPTPFIGASSPDISIKSQLNCQSMERELPPIPSPQFSAHTMRSSVPPPGMYVPTPSRTPSVRNNTQINLQLSPRRYGKDGRDQRAWEKIIGEKLQDEPSLRKWIVTSEALGCGQFGIVYRGHSASSGFAVAVKIIDKRKIWGNAQLAVRKAADKPHETPKLVKKELEILQRLSHPNILRLHEAIHLPSHSILITDLAPSGDLLTILLSSPMHRLPEPQVRSLFAQMIQAVQYLHSMGVTHRDLKPENILMNGDQVIVADFGFASEYGSLYWSVVGTPSYMAPEIVSGNGYGNAADLWSLGVILYICLGGVFPFDASTPVVDQIKTGEFYFPDEQFADVTDDAVDLCCRLLVVDTTERFTCQDVMNHHWYR